MGPTENASYWQAEADLLADGRELLERLTDSLRHRHLYPEGPDLSLLLSAYRELDRRRLVHPGAWGARRRRRVLGRLLRDALRRDALARDRRLQYRVPVATPQPGVALPPLCERALGAVDGDVRAAVRERLQGTAPPGPPEPGVARGLVQLREALVVQALRHPSELCALPDDVLLLSRSAEPHRRRHPIATLLLVKLPFYLWLFVVGAFSAAYAGAYVWFNDERLGDFIGDNVSGLIDGDLVLRSVHWRPRLLFDLVTGTPTPLTVRGVEVWGPYKRLDLPRDHLAARAERLETRLSLHEIIPWNRLGVPPVFDIPWNLRFVEPVAIEPMEFDVRRYSVELADGRTATFLGLLDAFVPLDQSPNQQRGLSYLVESGHLQDVVLGLDFLADAGWAVGGVVRNVAFDLAFVAPPPGTTPRKLPFGFSLGGELAEGVLRIDEIEVPLGEIDIDRFECALGAAPAGDVEVELVGDAAGSTVRARAALRDAFTRDPPGPDAVGVAVEVAVSSSDPDSLVTHLLGELGLAPDTVEVPPGARVAARIDGPLSDPRYRLAGEGLIFAPVDDAAWAFDDLRVALELAHERIPRRWRRDYPDDARRRVVTLRGFEGAALDGTAALVVGDEPATIVMPDGVDEPYRIGGTMALQGVNPGRLPEDPDLAARLQGDADGRLEVRELQIWPATPSGADHTTLGRTELAFAGMRLRRDRGPTIDGLPRDLALDGALTVARDGGLRLDELRLATDGGSVIATGGVHAGFERLEPTLVRAEVSDGRAFAGAFGLPSYFDQLEAALELTGAAMAPDSAPGRLTVSATHGTFAPTSIQQAKLALLHGTLRLDHDDVVLAGGRGSVTAELVLFDGGKLLSEPRIKAVLDLDDVELPRLLGPTVAGRGELRLEIDDGHGQPVALGQLQARGAVFADRVSWKEVEWRDATATFTATTDALDLHAFELRLHRHPSPFFAADASVASGSVTGRGRVRFADDPELDLELQASAVPLALVGRFVDQAELPVRGEIAAPSRVHVGGTLARPSLEGEVRIEGLSAAGVYLGDGRLRVRSEDVPAVPPLSPHREVRVAGDFAATTRKGMDPMRWTVDAVLAVGPRTAKTPNPTASAQIEVGFAKVPVSTLLEDPTRPAARAAVDGVLEGLRAQVLSCGAGPDTLSDCVGRSGPLHIGIELDRAFVGPPAVARSADPCADPETLCTDGRLAAELHWPLLTLVEPWRWRAPAGGVPLELTGSFDLASSTDAHTEECDPAAIRGRASTGGGRAQIRGSIDLQALRPFLVDQGLIGARGRVDADVELLGTLFAPQVRGTVRLLPGSETLKLEFDQKSRIPMLEFPVVEADLDGDVVRARGTVRLAGESLEFGANEGQSSHFVFGGPCAGSYQLAARGSLSAQAVTRFLDLGIPVSGAVDVEHVLIAGRAPELGRVDAVLGFGRNALAAEIGGGFEPIEIRHGRIELAYCNDESRCPPEGTAGRLTAWIGGRRAAEATSAPTDALQIRIGKRKEAWAWVWGRTALDADFTALRDTSLSARLQEVPYRTFDGRGRPELEVAISSDRIVVEGSSPVIVHGDVSIDYSRWVKDVAQSVDLLRVFDEREVDPAPTTSALRGTQFDLHVETTAPFRIENNVASGVEARVDLDLAGTWEAPEFDGHIDVDSGGTVKIPFFSGTYEIQRGKISFDNRVEDATIDLVTQRREPVFIDQQPRRMLLLLRGTLNAIRPDCVVEGTGTGTVERTRDCVNYLLLGAGDVNLSPADVRRAGAGGLLSYARKPLEVVGNAAELDVSRRIDDSAPRLGPYLPDVRLRLDQLGPELEVATPRSWFDFDYGFFTLGWDYVRGYPGSLLRQNRELSLKLRILEPATIELRQSNRSYLNQRIIFDPLQQRTVEFRFDFEIPSLR